MSYPFPTEDSALDEAIASAYSDLKSKHADEDAHDAIVKQLNQLYKLKYDAARIALEFHQTDLKHQLESEKHAQEVVISDANLNLEVERWSHQLEQDARPFYARVDPNTVLTVAANVFIGLAVIKYEQTGVISSKVLSFMKKI